MLGAMDNLVLPTGNLRHQSGGSLVGKVETPGENAPFPSSSLHLGAIVQQQLVGQQTATGTALAHRLDQLWTCRKKTVQLSVTTCHIAPDRVEGSARI
jgi:hypothetical protein